MIIRPVHGKDDAIAAYPIETISYPPEAAAALDAYIRRSVVFPGYFLVAEVDGGIKGVTNGVRLGHDDLSDESIKQMKEYDANGPYFCILTVAVHPEYRGRGIGRELVRHVIEKARQDGLKSIVLLCERPLVPFYEQLGFHYVKPSESSHGGIVWHQMSLPL